MNGVVKYFKHKLKSKSIYSIHSPFLFHWVNEIFLNENDFEDFYQIAEKRSWFAKDKRKIKVKDLGAGSKVMKGPERKIADIYRYNVKKEKYGKYLYRIAENLNAKKVLEFGTSLGVSTAYLAKGNSQREVWTVEACPNILKEAQTFWKHLGLNNVKAFNVSFEDFLEAFKTLPDTFDIIYLDGNHQLAPTLAYLEALTPFLNEGGVVIMDDINWSNEMREAWAYAKNMEEFTLCLELLDWGVLFKKEECSKEIIALSY